MATMLPPARPARRVDYGFLLYFMLHALGFIATTLLMTWGILVLFFLAIGGFSLDGMMHQVANMSSRYIVADPARIDQFKLIVGVVHMVVAIALIFFRRHAILPRDPARLEHGA